MAKHINYNKEDGLLTKDILQQFPKTELTAKAKSLHLRGYSSKKVDELRDMIAQAMLTDEVILPIFRLFTDEQIALFEKASALSDGYEMNESESADAAGILRTGYALVDEDNRLLIPKDAASAYARINNDAFQASRREYVWLLDCLDAGETIYGVMPQEQLVRMYNARKGYKKTLSQLLEMHESLDPSVCGMRLENGKLIAAAVYDDYRDIEKMQGNEDFYLPSVAEILDISRNFFPSQEAASQKLIAMLQTDCGKSLADANRIVCDIWEQFSKSYQVEDVLGASDAYDLTFSSTRGMDDFKAALVELSSHTRMMIYRGFQPVEIAEQELSKKAASSPLQGFGAPFAYAPFAPAPIAPTPTKKAKKIYPNDPCPCGSGKKYKHCHGKKA